MNSTWIILGIIYGICLIPSIILTKMLCQEIRMIRPNLLFLTIWLVLPLFPIYLIFFKKKNNTPKLPYTTEVHCHVLPGIDDGSPDVEHSLALIHQMKEWGLERIIATPHVTEASFENTPQTIGSAYSRLCLLYTSDAADE